MTDYTDILQKGQRIAYWWSDEDSWLKGTISKAILPFLAVEVVVIFLITFIPAISLGLGHLLDTF